MRPPTRGSPGGSIPGPPEEHDGNGAHDQATGGVGQLPAFAMIPVDVIDSGLDPISKAVHGFLVARLGGRPNGCLRGYRTVSEGLDLDEDTVADRLRRLEAAGLVDLHREGKGAMEVRLAHDLSRRLLSDRLDLPSVRPPGEQGRRRGREPKIAKQKGTVPDRVGEGGPNDAAQQPDRKDPPRSRRGGGSVPDHVGDEGRPRSERAVSPIASGTEPDRVGEGSPVLSSNDVGKGSASARVADEMAVRVRELWPGAPRCDDCGKLTKEARGLTPPPALGAFCRCALAKLLTQPPSPVVLDDEGRDEDDDCRCVECGKTCERVSEDGTPYCEAHLPKAVGQ